MPMIALLAFVLVSVLLSFLVNSWWEDMRSRRGIQDWMLDVQGLHGLCQDYLEYVENMTNGSLIDIETLRWFDAQRQVTHDQILQELGLDRDFSLDMLQFARMYLGRS